MGLDHLEYEDGQTPLDEDEKEGLLLPWVTTQGELNEVEQHNIEHAMQWTMKRRKNFKVEELLSEEFIRELHRRMFGDVWSWAGEFRKTNKNIGVDKFEISVALRMLLEDCKFWIENKTFSNDEIAIRFSHRIVAIHCFPNGNGRHSRLIADIIIEHLFGGDVFTWGEKNLIEAGKERATYLEAIRAADNGDYVLLIKFARS